VADTYCEYIAYIDYIHMRTVTR